MKGAGHAVKACRESALENQRRAFRPLFPASARAPGYLWLRPRCHGETRLPEHPPLRHGLRALSLLDLHSQAELAPRRQGRCFEGHDQHALLPRRKGRGWKAPSLYGQAIALQGPAQHQARRRREVPLAAQLQRPTAAVKALELQGRSQGKMLPEPRMGTAVGVDQAVEAEVSIVGHIAKIAAVAIGPRLRSLPREGEPLVDPIPDEAALELGIAVEDRPVIGQAPIRVAHGVAVFAKNNRSLHRRRLGKPHQPLMARIHGADQIRGGHRKAPPGAQAPRQGPVFKRIPRPLNGALVMNHAGGIKGPEPGRLSIVHRRVARFIAEGPGDDAGVITVPLGHAANAGGDGRLKAGVHRKAVLPRVALNVRLIKDEEPDLVAQVVKHRVIGIVRRAHGVKAEALDLQKVRALLRRAKGLAPFRVVLMAVYPAHRNGNAVDAEFPLVDGHGAKAHSRRKRLHQHPGRIKQLEHRAIKRRRFRRPELGTLIAPR